MKNLDDLYAAAFKQMPVRGRTFGDLDADVVVELTTNGTNKDSSPVWTCGVKINKNPTAYTDKFDYAEYEKWVPYFDEKLFRLYIMPPHQEITSGYKPTKSEGSLGRIKCAVKPLVKYLLKLKKSGCATEFSKGWLWDSGYKMPFVQLPQYGEGAK